MSKVLPTWKPRVPFWTLRGVRNKPVILAAPQALFDFWLKHAPREFPGLDMSERAFALSLSGLVDFVRACAISRVTCILPSVSADSVWHAWLAWDEANFKDFFAHLFGAVPAHHPSEELELGQGVGLQNTWLALSLMDRTVPIHHEMPALFRLDRKVMATGGFAYGWCNQVVFHSKIVNAREIDSKFIRHPELTGLALMTAFALWPGTEEILAAHLKANESSGGGGGGDGSIGTSGGCDADAGDGGCSDGGSGGGGDGGGCGGGCGG